MVSEMFDRNRNLGLTLPEAAKMEMATSLAMLSSGAITTFWLLFHICSNPEALEQCRSELSALVKTTSQTDTERYVNVVDVSLIKKQCPTMLAMLQETLRFHSTLINIKKVHHDTTLANQYLLKKDAIIMIPGTAVHHDTEIWGASATSFDHRRFATPEGQRKLGSTLAYRPFGAGATMCPGRHFSTNVILSFAAMVLLQFDVESASKDGMWNMPSKWNADMWNAMPRPDSDIPVRVTPRKEMEVVNWKFLWGGELDSESGEEDSE
jgi:cytochrome P450